MSEKKIDSKAVEELDLTSIVDFPIADVDALLPSFGASFSRADAKGYGLKPRHFKKFDALRGQLSEMYNVEASKIALCYKPAERWSLGPFKFRETNQYDHLHIGFAQVVVNDKGYVKEPQTLQHEITDKLSEIWGRGDKPFVSVYEPDYDHYNTECFESHKEWEKISDARELSICKH